MVFTLFPDYKPDLRPRVKKRPAPPPTAPVPPTNGQSVGLSLFSLTDNFTISIRDISNLTIAECSSVSN